MTELSSFRQDLLTMKVDVVFIAIMATIRSFRREEKIHGIEKPDI